MISDLFSDGVAAIRLVNGMVRMEFASISVVDNDEQGKPITKTAFRVVMTPHGFVKTFGNMEKMIHSLQEANILSDPDAINKETGPVADTDKILSAEDRRALNQERRKRNIKLKVKK